MLPRRNLCVAGARNDGRRAVILSVLLVRAGPAIVSADTTFWLDFADCSQ